MKACMPLYVTTSFASLREYLVVGEFLFLASVLGQVLHVAVGRSVCLSVRAFSCVPVHPRVCVLWGWCGSLNV